MKFFIDTADVKEIREAESLGILDGVTTNPSLVAKTGRPFEETIKEILSIVKGPVSVEAVSSEAKDMLVEAHKFATWAPNVVIKLPTTKEGVKACKILSDEGIKTNLTLCFSATQALLVAKAGATYVSPFVGRLDDISQDGMDLIRTIVDIYDIQGFATEVLAASIRHPMHVVWAAQAGAQVATIPAKVIEQMFHHPLTDAGLATFNKDWAKVKA